MDIFVEPGFRAGNIKDYDFISIMSNLLDNSLEAGERCPEGERSIELKMFMDTDRSYAVIRLENSCINKAVSGQVSGQGIFLTAKADRTRHGIGLKHVKKLIESNHGLIDFDVHTNTFCVTVCLSVPPRQAG